MRALPPGLVFPALLLLAALLLWLNLLAAPGSLDWGLAWADLLRGRESLEAIILGEIRLPRALLALCAGMSLGLAGAVLQGLLRNPLASPDLLGVSQSAALGAILALYFGASALAWWLLPLSALTGAGLAALLIFLLAGRLGDSLTLILAGIAINALAGSLSMLALTYAPNPFALQEVYFWLLGSVADRSWQELRFALPFMLLGWGLMLSRWRLLDALSLGEDGARSLGFALERDRWLLVLGVTSATGATVAVCGNIAFVGLLVPHLLRPLAAQQPGRLLWLSAPGGGCLLLLADSAVQVLPGAQELQLGVLTAALGGPFFLWLIVRERRRLAP